MSCNNTLTTVRWFVGGACNLACPYCVNSEQEHKAAWTMGDVGKVVELVNAVTPVSTLMVIGGEPTCVPWLADMLVKFHAKIRRVELLTNGILMGVLREQVHAACTVAEHVTVLITVHPIAWQERGLLAAAIDDWLTLHNDKVSVQIKCLLTDTQDVHACEVNQWVADLVPCGHLLAAARRVPSNGPTMREVVTALRTVKSSRLKRLLTLRAKNENRQCPYAGKACPVAGYVVNVTPWGVTGVRCGVEQHEYIPWSTSVNDIVDQVRAEHVTCPDRQLGCNCDATVDNLVASSLGLQNVDYVSVDL